MPEEEPLPDASDIAPPAAEPVAPAVEPASDPKPAEEAKTMTPTDAARDAVFDVIRRLGGTDTDVSEVAGYIKTAIEHGDANKSSRDVPDAPAATARTEKRWAGHNMLNLAPKDVSAEAATPGPSDGWF